MRASVDTVMKALVLIALVSCSLGILVQSAASEEPVESAAERETIDSSDGKLEEELNEGDPQCYIITILNYLPSFRKIEQMFLFQKKICQITSLINP